MNKEERKKFILKSLLELDPNNKYFHNKIKDYLQDEDKNFIYSSPINPNHFQPIDSKHSIVLEKDVYDALQTIDQYNIDHHKEVPFILYGYETKGGAIIFDDIYCDFKKLKEDAATFENLEEFLYLRMQVFLEDKMKNKVICIGHTHPFSGKISFNYSFSDLACHIYYLEYDVFCNQSYNNKIFSLMKSVTQDYNFIYFDLKTHLFNKVTKVYVKKKKKEYILLDSFKNCDD